LQGDDYEQVQKRPVSIEWKRRKLLKMKSEKRKVKNFVPQRHTVHKENYSLFVFRFSLFVQTESKLSHFIKYKMAEFERISLGHE
jgi:hypothetical protein